MGFLDGSAGRECASNAEDTGNMDLIPMLERSLEEDMATWSNILAWRIPWSEEPEGLPFIRLQSQTQLKQLNTFHYIHIPQCVYQQHIHLSIDIRFLVVTNKTSLHIYV